MNFKTIVFDLDGTLVDSYPAIHESLNYTLHAFGLPSVDLQTVKKMVGKGLDNLIRNAVGDERKHLGIMLFRKSYDETVLKGTFLLPEVLETVRALYERGIKMAVASNKPSSYSQMILENLHLSNYFAVCYGPDLVNNTKPHPAMLGKLISELNTTIDETLYVGDMLIDVETARNAKVKVALIASGGNSADELRSANPDYFLQSFSHLLEIV